MLDYKSSGVDVEAGNRFVADLPSMLKSTWSKRVLPNFGAFASYLNPDFSRYENPVLAMTCDGVGTKIMLALETERYFEVGVDLVAMSVNDLLAGFAIPEAFLDYVAVGRLDPEKINKILSGAAYACQKCQCSLIGGETAEMPGLYPDGKFDLAGFAVGFAEKSWVEKFKQIKPGNKVYGLASSGVHSNGYSLIRKIIEHFKIDINKDQFEGQNLVDLILKPTELYFDISEEFSNQNVLAFAHITGGGIADNLVRVLPENVKAEIDLQKYPQLPVYKWLRSLEISDEESLRNTFNLGIGMMAVCQDSMPEPWVEIGEIKESSGAASVEVFPKC